MRLLSIVAAIALTGVFITSAYADIVSLTPNAFGGGLEYAKNGPPDKWIEIQGWDWEVEAESSWVRTGVVSLNPPPLGGSSVSPFTDTGSLSIGITGLPPSAPQSIVHSMTVLQAHSPLSQIGHLVLDTEILQMDYAFTHPILGPLMFRESPTLMSLGQATVTDLGGGQFRISSFFEVFLELSIDGGQSWVPSTTGASRWEVVPAPGAAALLGLGGLVATRRRRGS